MGHQAVVEGICSIAEAGAALVDCTVHGGSTSRAQRVLIACLDACARADSTLQHELAQQLVQACVRMRSAALQGCACDGMAEQTGSADSSEEDTLPALSALLCQRCLGGHDAAGEAEGCSMLASEQPHSKAPDGCCVRLCLPREAASVVLEEEAAAWAQLHGSCPGAASQACGPIKLALDVLLERVWPVGAHPAEHAGALALRARLALCCGSRAEQGCSNTQGVVESDLAAAEALLCSARSRGTGSTSSSTGAWLHAQGEVAAVRGALALQAADQARRGSHHEAGPSGTVPDQAQSPQKISAWAHAGQRCKEAMHALAKHAAAAESAQGAPADAAVQLLLELRWVVGLRGGSMDAQLAADAALQGLTLHGAEPLSEAVLQGLANAPAGTLLTWMLAPHACPSLLGSGQGSAACATPFSLQAITETGACGSCAEGSAQQLREVAHEAAARQGKGPEAALQRGLLHLLAAAWALRSGASCTLRIPISWGLSVVAAQGVKQSMHGRRSSSESQGCLHRPHCRGAARCDRGAAPDGRPAGSAARARPCRRGTGALTRYATLALPWARPCNPLSA